MLWWLRLLSAFPVFSRELQAWPVGQRGCETMLRWATEALIQQLGGEVVKEPSRALSTHQQKDMEQPRSCTCTTSSCVTGSGSKVGAQGWRCSQPQTLEKDRAELLELFISAFLCASNFSLNHFTLYLWAQYYGCFGLKGEKCHSYLLFPFR